MADESKAEDFAAIDDWPLAKIDGYIEELTRQIGGLQSQVTVLRKLKRAKMKKSTPKTQPPTTLPPGAGK